MRKITLDTIKKRVRENKMPIDILTEEYQSIHSGLRCRCLIDGHEWVTSGANLSKGHGCPKCGDMSVSRKRAATIQEVRAAVAKINPNIIIVSDYYQNNRTRLDCRCRTCGNEWQANANNLLSKKGCPVCSARKSAEKQRLPFRVVVDKLSIINPTVEILDADYRGAHAKTSVACKMCGHTWLTTVANMAHGHGCPKCNASKGERAVEMWLKSRGLRYEAQYRIEECRFKKPLPFDFAVFDGERLACLVEYQGVQHYKVDTYYGGEKAFRYTQNNDRIKREYCKAHGIRLVEVKYTVPNVAEYLDQSLGKTPQDTALTQCGRFNFVHV